MGKVIGVITAKLSPNGRIPNKVLLPLAGKTMLEHHIERMKAAESLDGVFVATSQWPGNEAVTKIAESCGCRWLAGGEYDVIARHIALCEREGAAAVIRIACDSPMFDFRVIRVFLGILETTSPEYIYVKNVPFHCSTMPELVSFEALKKAHGFYQGPAVTLPVWENWQKFKCYGASAPEYLDRPEYHLEVDTPVDYVVMSHIYAALYKGRPLDLRQVYEWLDDNPHIAEFGGAWEHSAINKRFLEAQRNATA